MWMDVIKNDEQYKDFTIIDPQPFNKYFKDEEFDYVQLYSIQEYSGGIIGFCGVCNWKNNELSPLDGDSYTDNMLVYGFETFDETYDGEKCKGINILVLEW